MRENETKEKNLAKWTPCRKKPPQFPCLATDTLGQVFIPYSGVVAVKKAEESEMHYYDSTGFDFNPDSFFNGRPQHLLDGTVIRIMPREIVAWTPLPEPYQENEDPDLPIDVLDLQVRSYNILKRAGVNTISDLRAMSCEDLMKVRYMGKKSMDDIVQRAQEFGITIKRGEQ